MSEQLPFVAALCAGGAGVAYRVTNKQAPDLKVLIGAVGVGIGLAIITAASDQVGSALSWLVIVTALIIGASGIAQISGAAVGVKNLGSNPGGSLSHRA